MLTLDQCKTLIQLVMGETVAANRLAQLQQQPAAELAEWMRKHMIAAVAAKPMEKAWPALARHLQGEAFMVAAENSVHFEALDSAMAALAAADIEPVFLKGIVLATTAYADRGLRPMVDIDLWLLGEQVAAAQAALHGIGYTSVNHDNRPLALQELMEGEIELVHPQWRQGVIDLHWSPLHGWWFRYAANVDRDAMWEQRQLLELSGGQAWQLCPEHLLIHLSLHLAIQSAFIPHTSYRAIFDIAHAVRAYEIDWAKLAQDARRWQVAPAVWHVLSLINHFAKLDGVESALSALQPRAWRRKLLYLLASPQSILDGRDLAESRLRFALTMSHIQQPQSLLRYLYRIVRPEKAWLVARYGAEASWLHHLRTTLMGG